MIPGGAEPGREARWRSVERLGSGVFDVLVVGGGIVGCRTAYEAARSGLRVALVDAGDFGGATSGASARLLHGGLRYLKGGAARLVRAASRERNVLASRIAPHLVRPVPFVAACGAGARRRMELAAGLSAYAALGGPRWPLPRPASERDVSLVPGLRAGGMIPRALFYEAQVDDGRLTLAIAKAAARAGAVLSNYQRVASLSVVPDGLSSALLDGPEGEIVVRCRAVVNATGPWSDGMRRMEDPRCEPLTRSSRGVHAVLRPSQEWGAAVAASPDDGSHLYAIPYDDVVLLGTTDDEYDGDPGAVKARTGDVSRLLDLARDFLPAGMCRPEAVVSSYAGLRVLPRGGGATVDAGRDHVLSVGRGGMVSVAGGKLTTHRRIALDAIRHLPAAVRPRRPRADATPLPGAFGEAVTPASIPSDATWRHLVRVYGAEAGDLLAGSVRIPGALEPVAPGGPDVWAQVHHAAQEEWAVTVDDVVRRRMTLALRGLDSPGVRAGISAVLGLDDYGPLSSRRTA